MSEPWPEEPPPDVDEPVDPTPADIEAEQAVLGAILIAGKPNRHTAKLTPDDFYRPQHADVYSAILALESRGLETDMISVGRELTDRGVFDKIGAGPFMHSLSVMAFPGAVAHHVDLIRDAAHRRRLYEFSGRVGQLSRHRAVGLDATQIIEQLRGELDQLAGNAATGTRRTVELGDLLRSRLEAYDEPTPPGLSTGWPEIDERLGGGVGMQPGRVYVIGARTGVGKTLVAINLAVAAAHAKTRVALFTLEMNADEVGDRIVSQVSGVRLERLQSHELDGQDRHKLGQVVHDFGGDPMTIDDSGGSSLSSIRSTCRDLTRATPKLGLVVVDYLQLVNAADKRVPRQEQVSVISRGLKVMAKELRVPVVALSQLNREVESRPDKLPRLSDLRESGSLEQDADVVMLLRRDEEHPAQLIVHIAKNRSGPNGIDVPLEWSPTNARLGSLVKNPA